MLLLCLLGVILVIGGLVLQRDMGLILTELSRAVFGVRVRARMPAYRHQAVRRNDPPPQLGSVPPPSVVTRPRR